MADTLAIMVNTREALPHLLGLVAAAAERGDLTPEQLEKAVKALNENLECLSSCEEGTGAVSCIKKMGPDCCPETMKMKIDCPPSPECCPEGIGPDQIDVQTFPCGEGEEGVAVMVCIGREAE